MSFDKFLSIVVLSLGFIELLLAGYYLIRPRGAVRFYFATLALCIFLWSLSNGLLNFIDVNTGAGELTTKFTYTAAAFLVVSFFLFARAFPTFKESLSNLTVFLLYVPAIILGYLSQFTDSIAMGVTPGGLNGVVEVGSLYHLYTVFILFYLFLGFTLLIKKYQSQQGAFRSQLRIFIIGSFVTGIIAINTNLLLVYFGLSSLGTIGPLAALSWVAGVYRIIRS